jgi:HK97 family phage portal protein
MKIIEGINNFFAGFKKKEILTLDQAAQWLRSQLTGSGYGNLSDAFKRQIWVYACIRSIASNFSQAPIKIYKKGTDKEVISGPSYQLFKTVNPLSDPFDLWYGLQVYKQNYGEAFIHIILNDAGVPSMIENLNPLYVKPIIDTSDNILLGWKYQKGNVNETIDKKEMLQFKYLNPDNAIRGLSPLSAAQKSIETDDRARELNLNMLKFGQFPGSAIEVEKKLDDKQYERLKKQVESRHKGSKKAGRLLLLEGGAKYKETKINNNDIQYIDQRKLTKEEIHASFSVHTAITGSTDAFNRANMQEIKKEFWTKLIIPELMATEFNLNTNFFDVYFPDEYCMFDISKIAELQTDHKLLAEISQIYINMYVPFVEVNRRFNLKFEVDQYPWLKTSLVPFNLIDAYQLVNGSSTTPATQENDFFKLYKSIDSYLHKKNKSTEEKKYIIWKSFIQSYAPLKNKYQSALRTFLFSLRQEVLNNFYENIGQLGIEDYTTKIKKQIEADIPLFDFNTNLNKLKEMSTPFIEDAVKQGKKLALEELSIEAAFELTEPNLIDFFNLKIRNLEQILLTTQNNIKKTLQGAIEAGLTVEETAEEIRGLMTVTANRSRTIARTEIGGAINGGKNETFINNGVEFKEWVQSFDDDVRETHRLSGDSSIVPIGEPFENGLMFPNDPAGPVEEVVNCRCTMAAVIKEAEE